MVNKYQTKLFLLFIIIIPLLSYSCTALHPLRGKERDLLIEKLEKNHGINPSEVLVANCYYAKTQYQEVLTKKIPVIKERSPITYIERPRSSPCLQLLPPYEKPNEVILAITENELLIFNITDKKYQYPLYELKYSNIKSIWPSKSFGFIANCSGLCTDGITILLDDKNAISLAVAGRILGPENRILTRLLKFINKKGVKEFNMCQGHTTGAIYLY